MAGKLASTYKVSLNPNSLNASERMGDNLSPIVLLASEQKTTIVRIFLFLDKNGYGIRRPDI
jgi:hypothetical protein